MRKTLVFFVAWTLVFYPIETLWAQTIGDPLPTRRFDPNYIIDDLELVAFDDMSLEAIRSFLNAQPGILGHLELTDDDGRERSAAEIIWRASNKFQINPKFLIVLLQKEQSLIEDSVPTQSQLDWATGFAVCDDCRTDDPALLPFRGFVTQVYQAAARQRYYIEHPREFTVRVGQTTFIDNQAITPLNQATANLYIYTPHLAGNINFWNLWERYFARHYPDGSLLKDALTEEIWLLENGGRRQITTLSVLHADDRQRKIVTATHADLQRYDIGLPIKFAEYSLLRSPRGTIYLLVNGQRRGFVTREVFRSLGYNPGEVIDATWDDLLAYPEGLSIAEPSTDPIGRLIQDTTSGGVFFVVDNVRHPIWAREILRSRFQRLVIEPMTKDELEKIPLGSPIGFRDGELVTTDGQPTVFVISHGQRRPITSRDVFTALGYQWSNIIHTSPRGLEANPLGQALAG